MISTETPKSDQEWEDITGRHWDCGEKHEDCDCNPLEVECYERNENDKETSPTETSKKTN